MLHELLRTNPVWTLDQLAADPATSDSWLLERGELDEPVAALARQGIALPSQALARWRAAGRLSEAELPCSTRNSPKWIRRSGVFGLVQDRARDVAYVVPIECRAAEEWRVEPPLPQRAEEVVALLRRLCLAGNSVRPHATDIHSFPEALGVALWTSFSIQSEGPSMDVSLVLAALAHFAGAPLPCLAAACSVVQAEGSRLVPVGHVGDKVAAFVREVGRGSLLVRSGACAESSSFDAWFDEVWVVDSLGELASQLFRVGLLAPLSSPTLITPTIGEHLLAKLRVLAVQEERHVDAADLAERLLGASWTEAVPRAMRVAASQFLPASLRHLGRYADALSAAQAWNSHAENSECTSVEERAAAALEVAASLFDPGRESEALAVLSPWLNRIEAEPRLLSARMRVRIWNTTARAMSAIGQVGWESLFEQSLALQAQDDPRGLARTENYLVAAQLRAGLLDQAELTLGARPRVIGVDPWRGFLWAELARRRQEVWRLPDLDVLEPIAGTANHALGYYLQATARQPIADADAAARFARAAMVFAFDVEERASTNVLWILLHTMRFASAQKARDPQAAVAAAADLQSSVTQPGLGGLVRKIAALLPTTGDSELEPLLAQLPWS